MSRHWYKDHYEKYGYVTGLRGLADAQAQELLGSFERNRSAATKHGLLSDELIYKPHLFLHDFNEIISEPRITDPVKQILGPDIVCWTTMLFYKQKNQFVGFHQDLKYWRFKDQRCLTVSLALTVSNESNGCLRVIPGSHVKDFEHKTGGPQSRNMLVYSQSVNTQNLEKKSLELLPGEFSIHHGDIVHGSESNKSDNARVLLAIRYCSSDNCSEIYKSASWVGPKRFSSFIKEPEVESDFEARAVKFRERLLKDLTILHASRLLPLLSKKPLSYIVSFRHSRRFYYRIKTVVSSIQGRLSAEPKFYVK